MIVAIERIMRVIGMYLITFDTIKKDCFYKIPLPLPKIKFIMMRGKIVTILIVLVFVATAVLVYVWRRNHVDHWNEVACRTFKEVLDEDLKSRNDLKVPFYRGGGLTSVADTIPQSVFVKTEKGRKEYEIDIYKHRNNIVLDSQTRMLHSIMLEERPLNPDTINAKWKCRLTEHRISASTLVRVSVTDLDYYTAVGYSQPYNPELLKDSLFVCYVGYRCEAEIACFANYAWINNFGVTDYLKFSMPLLLVLVFCVLDRLFRDKIKGYFIKKMSVVTMKENVRRIYRLSDGTLFDFDRSLLENSEHDTRHLPSQSKILLKAFVEAKGHKLTSNEIMVILWPEGSGKLENVHQAVTRLRNILIAISKMTLVNEDYAYQLRIAHFIEEKPKSLIKKWADWLRLITG